MRKVLLAAALTFSVAGLAACGSGDSDDKIAETENGSVTKDEFYEAMKEQSGSDVLKELIINEVLEDKYDVSDDEVDEQIDELKEEIGDGFDDLLEQQGLNEEELRKDLKANLLQQEALAEDIDISDDEIEDYYENMQTEIKARHILVEDEETAEKVLDKLDDGDDFADLAKEYSEDSSAEDGGDIGFFTVGQMVPEFEEAAYKLDKDEVSEPVQSEYGFHIIEVLDKEDVDEDIGSLEDNEKEIRQNIVDQKVDPEEAQAKIQELVEESDIKINDEDLENIFDEDDQMEMPDMG
ncbi:MAG TPA: peptidylprolyl isomerase [Pseudogracilibacillus sp.]|nr:peptidylprolyl isomerase [Pseudogracilibacillus sp.]